MRSRRGSGRAAEDERRGGNRKQPRLVIQGILNWKSHTAGQHGLMRLLMKTWNIKPPKGAKDLYPIIPSGLQGLISLSHVTQ